MENHQQEHQAEKPKPPKDPRPTDSVNFTKNDSTSSMSTVDLNRDNSSSFQSNSSFGSDSGDFGNQKFPVQNQLFQQIKIAKTYFSAEEYKNLKESYDGFNVKINSYYDPDPNGSTSLDYKRMKKEWDSVSDNSLTSLYNNFQEQFRQGLKKGNMKLSGLIIATAFGTEALGAATHAAAVYFRNDHDISKFSDFMRGDKSGLTDRLIDGSTLYAAIFAVVVIVAVTAGYMNYRHNKNKFPETLQIDALKPRGDDSFNSKTSNNFSNS